MARKASLLIALFTGLPLPALAWGAQGHEIAAHIAARELSPRARAEVAALLGGNAEAMMVTQSNWADEIRDARPETSRWHFVNIELDTLGYDRRRDCPGGDCIVAQIERDRNILADRRKPRAARAEALRLLIHFMADIHQPLHAADDRDRGGNDIKVRLAPGRNPTSLHQVWDTAMPQSFPGNDAGVIAAQIAAGFSPRMKAGWRSGAAADWANESFRLAGQEIYARLPDHRPGGRPILLPRDYRDREAPVVRAQLAKAGVRLAWLLNTALK